MRWILGLLVLAGASVGGAATLSGTVRDSESGAVLRQADVAAFSGGVLHQAVTGDDGGYEIDVEPGEWIVNAAAFGYSTAYVNATVGAGGAAGVDLELALRPRARVSGRVSLGDGGVPFGAAVVAVGTPAAPAAVDPAGDYVLELPRDGSYVLEARRNGYLAGRAEVALDGDRVEDFLLTPRPQECFENGGFDDLPWVMSGDADWIIDTRYQLQGGACAGSGAIVSNESSTMSVALDLEAGEFAFWVRTSTEPDGDILTFTLDGEAAGTWSGLTPWTLAVFDVEAGHHEMSWTYAKNAQLSAYADQVWVDVVGDPWRPATASSPAALAASVAPDQTERRTVLLSNPGELTLDFSVDTQHIAPNLKSGWPDAAGYRWVDSDEPDGPEFAWEDIGDTGTELIILPGFVTPVPLPIFFRFYGQNCNTMYVSSSGYVSFESDIAATNNVSLPSTNLPQAMVAPFWDSLTGGEDSRLLWQHDAAGRRVLVQWENMEHAFQPGPETFQLVLHQDGTILLRYLDVTSPTSCTVGIESWDGRVGQEVVSNAPYLRDGLAIRLDQRPSWLTVTPSVGHIPPGGSVELAVDFDAADLGPELYFGVIRLTTNDPQRPLTEIAAQLLVSPTTLVEPVPEPASELRLDASPNPFNPVTTLLCELPLPGPVELSVLDLRGRRVRTLLKTALPAGSHRIRWDGTDDDGRAVASGPYRCVLEQGDRRLIRSMVLLR